MFVTFPHAERWVRFVAAALPSEHDPRTLEDWAHLCAVSPPTLRTACYLAGVRPRTSLLFARICRAVAMAKRAECAPTDVLETGDPRTTRSILLRAGLVNFDECVSLSAFVERQKLIQQPLLLREFRRVAAGVDE